MKKIRHLGKFKFKQSRQNRFNIYNIVKEDRKPKPEQIKVEEKKPEPIKEPVKEPHKVKQSKPKHHPKPKEEKQEEKKEEKKEENNDWFEEYKKVMFDIEKQYPTEDLSEVIELFVYDKPPKNEKEAQQKIERFKQIIQDGLKIKEEVEQKEQEKKNKKVMPQQQEEKKEEDISKNDVKPPAPQDNKPVEPQNKDVEQKKAEMKSLNMENKKEQEIIRRRKDMKSRKDEILKRVYDRLKEKKK